MQNELKEVIKKFFEDKGYFVRQVATDEFSEANQIDFAGRLNFRVIKLK